MFLRDRNCGREPASQRSISRHVALFILTISVGGSLQAQSGAAIHSLATDPTDFSSLRLDASEAIRLEPGEWSVVTSASYFNQWNGTWHTRRIHEDLGRHRQPIGDDELTALETAFPEDEIYRFDLEGSRIDLLVARGFGRGVTLQARVPWIQIGTPGWDSIAEVFHSAVPAVDHYVRDLFPRGETFLYLRTDGRSVVHREKIKRSGVGDVSVSIAAPLRSWGRTEQRVALTIEAPTGAAGTLHGSGGWDAGVRWFVQRDGVRNDLLFGVGYTHQSRSGDFLGFERSDTAHLAFSYVRNFSARTAFHAGARLDTSPLSDVTTLSLGDPSLVYRFGVQRAITRDHWVSIEMSEELAPQMGVDADFSLHLAISGRY